MLSRFCFSCQWACFLTRSLLWKSLDHSGVSGHCAFGEAVYDGSGGLRPGIFCDYGADCCIGLAQVGEFSFILAQTGLSLNLINQNIYSILVACALVSIALNPFLVAAVPGTEKWLKTKPRLWDLLNMQVEKHSQELFKSYENQCAGDSEASYEGIIVGFGPSGRNAAEVLEKQGIIPVVVDMNIDTVADLNRQGKRAVFGHAGRQDILEAAGIHRLLIW